MPSRHKKLHIGPDNLPRLWLLTDRRNDTALETAIAALPAGSGVIFRHYHLDENARQNRFRELSAIARESGHTVILSDGADRAKNWRADGIYGAPGNLDQDPGLIRLATVHNYAELAMAAHIGADAVLVSPVFATRSHRNADLLGVDGFCGLAAEAHCPAIALGGMNADNYRLIPEGMAHGWAAIDGLSVPASDLRK